MIIRENIITFDSSTRSDVLSCFDKSIDSNGYIVERDSPTQKVITPDGEDIKIEEFAGIRKGSEIFLKSDLPTLIELVDKLN